MNQLLLGRRVVLGAALGLGAGALVSCNAIFGISAGIGAGGASSSTGAAGGPSSTTGAGGADAGPLKCDGTDPGGTDGSTAKWVVSAFNATGFGAGVRADGSLVFAGKFQGTNTVFGSAPLPFTDAGDVFDEEDMFVTRYLNGANFTPAPFLGPARVGEVTEGYYFNTAMLMAVDAQGRTAIAGNFRGSFTIGGTTLTAQVQPTDAGTPDDLDGFVALFDASWNPVWAPKRLGSVFYDSANGVAIDSQGNVVVLLVSSGSDAAFPVDQGCGAEQAAGSSDANPVFVTKIALDGSCAWHDAFTVANDWSNDNVNGWGLSLAVDPHDDVILAGAAIPAYTILEQGALGDDHMNQHPFAAKLSGADGSVTWKRAYEDANYQYVFAVATDPCGDILIGGGFDGTATFGTLTPPLKEPPGGDDSDQQGFLVKLDPDGVPLWQDAFTGLAWIGVTAIAVNHASDIALVGQIQDTATTTSAGVDFLGKTLPPPLPVDVGQTDFYVAKLKGDGSLRWVNRYSGDGYDAAFAVALDDAGHLVATGMFATTLDFGSGQTVTAAEGDDFWAVEFGP